LRRGGAAGHLDIGRGRRSRLPVLIPIALGVHDPEIVLGVLVEILGGDAVAAGRRFPRQRNIALEDLIGIAADLYVRSVAVEALDPAGHPRTAATTAPATAIKMRIIAVATA